MLETSHHAFLTGMRSERPLCCRTVWGQRGAVQVDPGRPAPTRPRHLPAGGARVKVLGGSWDVANLVATDGTHSQQDSRLTCDCHCVFARRTKKVTHIIFYLSFFVYRNQVECIIIARLCLYELSFISLSLSIGVKFYLYFFVSKS